MSLIKKQSVVGEIEKEEQTSMAVERLEYDGVMKMYMVGAEFPLKGAPTPDALWAVNIVKKTIIEFVRVQSYVSVLFFLNKKAIQRLLNSFNRIGEGVMSPYFNYKFFNQDIKMDLMSVSRGIGMFTENFLIGYGIVQETAHKTAELLAHVIEFDGFYRYKLLDLLNEADFINNPRKEVQRLLQICYEREEILTTYMRPKLKVLMWGAWILAIPSFKKAWMYAVQNTNLDLFKIDEGDYYWMCMRIDYHYFGKTNEERMNILKEKGYKIPILNQKNNE